MTSKLFILTILLTSAVFFSACSSKQQTSTENTQTTETPAEHSQGTHDMMAMDMTVENDQQFLQKMIPHHIEAIDSSKFVLQQTENAELKTFLENIITTQTREVNDMKTWYGDWFKTEYVDDGKYMPMMGDLTGVSGEELEKLYLEGMVKHHQGAVQMADSILPKAEHSEVKNLADRIKKTQTAEVAQMQKMLTD